jgi:hypothetical protein
MLEVQSEQLKKEAKKIGKFNKREVEPKLIQERMQGIRNTSV